MTQSLTALALNEPQPPQFTQQYRAIYRAREHGTLTQCKSPKSTTPCLAAVRNQWWHDTELLCSAGAVQLKRAAGTNHARFIYFVHCYKFVTFKWAFSISPRQPSRRDIHKERKNEDWTTTSQSRAHFTVGAVHTVSSVAKKEEDLRSNK